jgi:hypothetical protein
MLHIKLSKLRSLYRTKKRLLLTLAVLACLMCIGVIVFFRQTNKKPIPAKKPGMVFWNGKYVPAPLYTGKADDSSGGQQVDTKQEIAELEAKIAKRPASYQDYLALAQVYLSDGNKAKAIENFEKATKTADPKMKYYKEFIDSTAALIQQLKENK